MVEKVAPLSMFLELSSIDHEIIRSIIGDDGLSGRGALLRDNLLCLSEIAHFFIEGPYIRGVHASEDGKDLVTYRIPSVFDRGVGTVLPVWDLMTMDIALNLLAGEFKEGTYEPQTLTFR